MVAVMWRSRRIQREPGARDSRRRQTRRDMFTSNEILDLAVQIEKNGEKVYRQAIESIADPRLEQLLHWMADEESNHREWFENRQTGVDAGAGNPFIQEMSQELFNDLLGEKNFSHQEVDFHRIDDLNQLIAVFIEFEKDTVLFYEMLMPFVEDGAVREQLQGIIEEEKAHIRSLQDFKADETSVTAASE
jgi:rubrerythrin